MSTPAQLLNELRSLWRHYAEAASRKARIIAEMNAQTNGVWINVHKLPLVVGKTYFVRAHLANGFRTPATLKRWESHGWVALYGTEYKMTDADELQVLVPTTPAKGPAHRRPKGRKS